LAKIGHLSGLMTEISQKPMDQPVGAETITATGTASFPGYTADICDSLLVSNLPVIRIRGSPAMIANHETTPSIYFPPTSQHVGRICVAKNRLVSQFS